MKDEEIEKEAEEFSGILVYAKSPACRYEILCNKEGLRYGFIAGAKWARQSQWVKCSERLPEKQAEYLIVLSDGTVMSANWEEDFQRSDPSNPYWFCVDHLPLAVSHWRHLPEPPKEEPKE